MSGFYDSGGPYARNGLPVGLREGQPTGPLPGPWQGEQLASSAAAHFIPWVNNRDILIICCVRVSGTGQHINVRRRNFSEYCELLYSFRACAD